MNTALWRSLLAITLLVLGGCATCGPGTVRTDGDGWGRYSVSRVCLPISTVSDCTEYQMVEEDGGGWRSDRDGGGWRYDPDGGGWRVDHDGGGWRVDRDGGGWRVDPDGGGWRRERDEPHHPGDAGDELRTIAYVPAGVCRIGVPPLEEE